MAMRSDLRAVHLPSFFKAQLMAAAAGRDRYGHRWSYYDVGFHLGQHHVGTFYLDEGAIAGVTADEEAMPTATLRRLLATEEHPDAPMVEHIPEKRRRTFLEGLVDGVIGDSRYDPDSLRYMEGIEEHE